MSGFFSYFFEFRAFTLAPNKNKTIAPPSIPCALSITIANNNAQNTNVIKDLRELLQR